MLRVLRNGCRVYCTLASDMHLSGWNVGQSPSFDGRPTQVDGVSARSLHSAFRSFEHLRTYDEIAQFITNLRFRGEEVSIATYNTGLRLLSRTWADHGVWRLYQDMLASGIHADRETYCIVLTVLTRADWKGTIESVEADMRRKGFNIDTCPFVTAALIPRSPDHRARFFNKCKRKFPEMGVAGQTHLLEAFLRNAVSYEEGLMYLKQIPGAPESCTLKHLTVLMGLLVKGARGGGVELREATVVAVEEISRLAREMGLPVDRASCNVVVAAYALVHSSHDAAGVMMHMLTERIGFSEHTVVSFINTVFGDETLSEQLRVEVAESAWCHFLRDAEPTIRICTVLMQGYARSHSHRWRLNAQKLLHFMRRRRVKMTAVLDRHYLQATGGSASKRVSVEPSSHIPILRALELCREAKGKHGPEDTKGQQS